jgi:REP element-mobilizing transposase RayT
MTGPLFQQHVKMRQGAHLPHWTLEGAIYHVVFRLADSLPADVLARFRAEREALVHAAKLAGASPVDLAARLRALFSQRIESVLDGGLGACWFARHDLAALAADSLRKFDGTRYALHAWCVMPNHVHALVQPQDSHELPDILKSWKGFIARESNRRLSRPGEFWQPEYYDHLIRSEAELAQTVRYIQSNPSQAGLPNWPWVWPPVI